VNGFLQTLSPNLLQRRAIRSQQIRHDLIGGTMSPHRFLEEFHCFFHVAPLRHEAFEHFALVVDGPPRVMQFTINLHKNLVQTPPSVTRPHPRNPDGIRRE